MMKLSLKKSALIVMGCMSSFAVLPISIAKAQEVGGGPADAPIQLKVDEQNFAGELPGPNAEEIEAERRVDLSKLPRIVECRHNGSGFQPFSLKAQRFIGRPGYGFSSKENCEQTASVTNAEQVSAVCSWSGTGYAPYNTENSKSMGHENYGFQKIESCHATLRKSQAGLLCNWNGGGYSPIRISDGRFIGKEGYGTNDLDKCVEGLATANTGYICNWNGHGYRPYRIHGNISLGRDNFAFGERKDCQYAIRNIKNSEICVWDGHGFTRIKTTEDYLPVAGYFKKFADCLSYRP